MNEAVAAIGIFGGEFLWDLELEQARKTAKKTRTSQWDGARYLVTLKLIKLFWNKIKLLLSSQTHTHLSHINKRKQKTNKKKCKKNKTKKTRAKVAR